MRKMTRRVFLSAVDRQRFKSICVDSVFIYLNKQKIQITEAGIFNQVRDYFTKTRKENNFLLWLAETYGASDEDSKLPTVEAIQTWERQLLITEKVNVHSKMLRVVKLNNGYDFYGIVNSKGQLDYLARTGTYQYPKVVIDYLCYNNYVNQVCFEENLDHALDYSFLENTRELNTSLRHNLIPVIDEIKVLSNKPGYDSLGFYDLETGSPLAPTPAWDSFISSIPNDGSRECFKAWIYSLFKDDNFGRQILWLHGKGNSGKSVVAQSLITKFQQINPLIVTSLEPAMYRDKFSAASYVKKRLTVAQDSTDRSMVKDLLIKNITGNDTAAVVKKGFDKGSENIYSKLFVTSNYQPWLSPSKPEELSRMMYIFLDPEMANLARTSWDSVKYGEWSIKINHEIDDFIAKCKVDYEAKLLPDGHNLEIYPQMITRLSTNTFLSDNLKNWWATCVRKYTPTEHKKSNVIYYEELLQDYKRFLGKRTSGGKYDIGIQTATLPFLLSMGITANRLTDTNNSLYIMGYEFLPLKERSTLDELLKKRAEEMGVSGKMSGEVYATRLTLETEHG